MLYDVFYKKCLVLASQRSCSHQGRHRLAEAAMLSCRRPPNHSLADVLSTSLYLLRVFRAFLTTLMIKANQDSYWQHKSLFQDDTSTYSLITVINKIIIMTLPCSPVLKKPIQILQLKDTPASFFLTQKEIAPALLGNRRAS